MGRKKNTMSGFVNPAPWVPAAGASADEDAPAAAKKNKRKILAVVGVMVLIVAICVGGGFVYVNHRNAVAAQQAQTAEKARVAANRMARLDKANSWCKFTLGDSGETTGNTSETVSVGDGGKSLTYSGTQYSGVKRLGCLLGQLKAPESLVSKMNATSGLDGMQTDSWDGIKVTWSYNGNSGFNAVFEYE